MLEVYKDNSLMKVTTEKQTNRVRGERFCCFPEFCPTGRDF